MAMPTDEESFAANLADFAEEHMSTFRSYLEQYGYEYTDEEVDELLAAIKRRAGRR